MSYAPPPPPPPAVKGPYNRNEPVNSPDQPQNQFVSVPTTPMVQPEPYYEDLKLHPHSPYSIQRDNYIFLLEQCWRIRLGCRFVVLISSIGVVAAVTYVVNVYNSTKRHTGGLWRDGHGEGGIDMSPVSVLLAVGVVVMCFSVVMVVGSWVPKINHINNLSDTITVSLSSISLIMSMAAVIYSFQHPSMNVDFDSPSPVSFRKYACTVSSHLFHDAESAGVTGDPLGGVDGRAVILFSSMCGQFNLAWVLTIIVIVFEAFIMASVPLGRKWRRALEEVEVAEEKLLEDEKYRRKSRRY